LRNRENSRVFKQNSAAEDKGLNQIRRIEILQPRSKVGAGLMLTGKGRFDWRARASGGRRKAIGRPGISASGSSGGVRPTARLGGGAAPASGGATAARCWGAPNATRVAPKRSGAHGEPHGGHPERRRRGAAIARRATAAVELR
jgi:hypothetical protein